jgi:hypothetical protein
MILRVGILMLRFHTQGGDLMYGKVSIAIVVTSVLLFGCLTSQPFLNEDVGPYCFAEFCFDVDSIIDLHDEAYVIKKYGSVGVAMGKITSYCYYDEADSLYFKLTPYHGENRPIVQLLVAEDEICLNSLRPKNYFYPAETKGGLKIGDSVEKLVRLYGSPVVVKDNHGDDPWDKIYRYTPPGDELLFTDVYIENENVIGLLISVSP